MAGDGIAGIAGITEHTARVPSCPKPVFYLAAGPSHGPIVIFVHGWPELSISWRHQLKALGALGFRAVAPDMRGYGRSYIPDTPDGCRQEHNVADMLGLLDHLRGLASQAVWVGHDWGAPIVWNLAAHHPERCAAVAGLVVPHGGPRKPGAPTLIDVMRGKKDAGQWDYQLHHNDHPEEVAAELDRDIRASVTAIFQATYEMPPPRRWNKYIAMHDQRRRFRESGGRAAWFDAPAGGAPAAPPVRDARMVTEDDVNRYVEGLERNGGFRVPNFYYLNHKADGEYSATGVKHGGILHMPVLMVTAAYDTVCTPAISTRMEEFATRLTRAHLLCGHWAQQERPAEVNAALARWLATAVPGHWPRPETLPDAASPGGGASGAKL